MSAGAKYKEATALDAIDKPLDPRTALKLNAAYRVLSDPERRSKYDAQRAHMWRARPAATMVRPNGASAAAAQPSAVVGSRPVVLPMPQIRPSWRVGRLVILLLVLMAIMGAMLFAFWMLAGILDDDPHLMLRATMTLGRAAS